MEQNLKVSILDESQEKYRRKHKDFSAKLKFARLAPLVAIVISMIVSAFAYAYEIQYVFVIGNFILSVVPAGLALVLFVGQFGKIIIFRKKTITVVQLILMIVSVAINAMVGTLVFEKVELTTLEKGLFIALLVTLLILIVALIITLVKPAKISGNKVVRVGSLGLIALSLVASSVLSGLSLSTDGRKIYYGEEIGNGIEILGIANGTCDYVKVPSTYRGKTVSLKPQVLENSGVSSIYFEDDSVNLSGLSSVDCVKDYYFTNDFEGSEKFIDLFTASKAKVHVTENTYVSLYNVFNKNRSKYSTWSNWFSNFEATNPKHKYIFFDCENSKQVVDPIEFDNSYTFVSIDHKLNSYVDKNGRTQLFDTWYEDNEPISSKSFNETVILRDYFAPQYKITYNLNTSEGEKLLDLAGNETTNNVQLYSRLDPIDVQLYTASKEGYHFGGWNSSRILSIKSNSESDYSFTPQFDKIYPITYKDEYGTVISGIELNSYYYNQDLVAPSCPEEVIPAGYHFSLWSASDGINSFNYAVGATLATKVFVGELNFTAYYSPNEYILTLDANGGTIHGAPISMQKVFFDSNYQIEAPTKTGYDFKGWFDENDVEYKTNETLKWEIVGNNTLVAKWEPHTYSLHVVGTSDVFKPTYDQEYDISMYTKEGYTLDSWEVELKDHTIKNIPSKGVWTYDAYEDGDVQINPIYVPNKYNLTVNYDDDNHTSKKYTFTYDAEYQIEQPVKYGYNFNKLITSDSEELSLTGTWRYAKDVSATATWTPKQFEVLFDSAGGTSVTSKQVTFNSSYSFEEPTRTGYHFAGWYYGNEKIDTEGTWKLDNGSSSFTLVAKWNPMQITFSFDPAGGTLADPAITVTATYGQAVPNFPTPTKEGYIFRYWENGDFQIYNFPGTWGYVMEGNMLLTAVYRPKVSTVHFDGNGVENPTGTVDVSYDGSVPTLPTLSREGYHFDGWAYGGKIYKEGDIWKNDVEGNITFTAQWSPLTYTVTLKNGNTKDTIGTKPVTYGQPYSFTAPEITGYTFRYSLIDGDPIELSGSEWSYASNKEIELFYEADQFTIFFEGLGTEEMLPQSVRYDESYTLPTPEVAGKTFNGWQIKDTEDYLPQSGTWNFTKDITVVAVWEE